MVRLASLVILSFTLFYPLAGFAQQAQMRDLDNDGFAEAAVLYAGSIPLKAVADRDQDGFAEAVYFYKDGRRDRAEIDLDHNGRPDQWISYNREGAPWKAAYDFDGDGQADYWVYYSDGRINKWEQDRNGDGRPDVRTYYNGSMDERGRPVFRQTYDDDFDGEFETRSQMSRPGARPAIPHSLAEALMH